MIKIHVKKKPYVSAWDEEDLGENYKADCTFYLTEDSSTTDILHAIVQAGLLESYHEESFINSMKSYIENYDYEHLPLEEYNDKYGENQEEDENGQEEEDIYFQEEGETE